MSTRLLMVVCAVFLVTCAAACFGETILLKDGSRMSGTIVGASADSILFRTPDGVLTIRRERIQSIDYGAEGAPTTAPAAPAPTTPAAPEVAKSSTFQFVLEPG